MTDYIHLRTGQTVSVSLKDRDQVKADIARGQDFWYHGHLVKISEIKEASIGRQEPQASRLPQGEVKTSGFWEKVLIINQERKEKGKTWIFGAAIDWAKARTSFTNPKDLIEFIDAEWDDQLAQVNRPQLRNPSYQREVWRQTHEALHAGKIDRWDVVLSD